MTETKKAPAAKNPEPPKAKAKPAAASPGTKSYIEEFKARRASR